jgi:predicted ribosome quality control (RQC) complex YloA/Tae2 family protein
MKKQMYSREEIIKAISQLRISHLEKELFEKLDNPHSNCNEPKKYLKGQNGNKFSRLEDNPEDSFFRLFNQKDDYAQFEFYGDGEEAIANRVFGDKICRIVSGNYQTGKSVRNVKPGRIRYVNDAWEVTELLDVALEK